MAALKGGGEGNRAEPATPNLHKSWTDGPGDREAGGPEVASILEKRQDFFDI